MTSSAPAGDVARGLNFLDTIGDLWLNETEHPLSDLFSVRRRKNVALQGLKTGRFSHSELVGIAECAVPLWSLLQSPLLTCWKPPLDPLEELL